MDWKAFGTVFSLIFVAELGDKTQLATLAFAARPQSPKWTVFLASAAALVLTSGVGVLAGTFISRHVGPKVMAWMAGLLFIGIGAFTILRAGSE